MYLALFPAIKVRDVASWTIGILCGILYLESYDIAGALAQPLVHARAFPAHEDSQIEGDKMGVCEKKTITESMNQLIPRPSMSVNYTQHGLQLQRSYHQPGRNQCKYSL